MVSKKVKMNNSTTELKDLCSYDSKVSKVWKDCKRTLKIFEVRHSQWLDKNVVFFKTKRSAHTLEKTSSAKKADSIMILVTSAIKEKTVCTFVGNYTLEELTLATRKSIHISGRRDAVKIVK